MTAATCAMPITRPGRWYHALAPQTAVVDCDGDEHRVTWRRGKLVLEDHDLTAERTMAVFGGEPCVCMRVLEMWRQQFGMPPDAFNQMQSWLGDNAYLAPTDLALGRELAMIVGWERAWRQSAHLHRKQVRLLTDELHSHALRPLREHLNAWKRQAGARMVSSVEVTLATANDTPSVQGRVEGISMRAMAHLGGRWVVDVWARGVAVVDGAFVVEVTEAATSDELEVRAVRWERHDGGSFAPVGAPALLERAPSGWHLTWRDPDHG